MSVPVPDMCATVDPWSFWWLAWGCYLGSACVPVIAGTAALLAATTRRRLAR